MLKELVVEFEVCPARVEEGCIASDGPEALARSRAEAKARQVSSQRPDALVIGADTLVVCAGEIIGKPLDRADAVRILQRLTSTPHTVLSGLCVIAPDGRCSVSAVATQVRMKPLTDAEIESYASEEAALACAGAYALEPDDPRVLSLDGSLTSVMGLPLEELRRVLDRFYPVE